MSSTALVDIGTLITSTRGVNGGRPCVAGTGTSVQHISVLYRLGMSAEEIVAELPHIEQKYIFAALTYYFANREAIDRQAADDEELGLRLAREHEATHQHPH